MLKLAPRLLLEPGHNFLQVDLLQVDLLQVDLEATRKAIPCLHRKGVEQNQMLGVDLAIPDTRSKVECRLPSNQRGCISSCLDQRQSTSLTDQQLLS